MKAAVLNVAAEPVVLKYSSTTSAEHHVRKSQTVANALRPLKLELAALTLLGEDASCCIRELEKRTFLSSTSS